MGSSANDLNIKHKASTDVNTFIAKIKKARTKDDSIQIQRMAMVIICGCEKSSKYFLFFNPSATVQLEFMIRAALLKGHTSGMGKEGDAYMNFLSALQCAFSCKANIDESYVKKLHTAQNHNNPMLSSSSW